MRFHSRLKFSFALAFFAVLFFVKLAQADVIYSQTDHGGTRTYGIGTNTTDDFGFVFMDGGGGRFDDLYAVLHFANFSGDALAHKIILYGVNSRSFVNSIASDDCWYVGAASSTCVDPATIPATPDLTAVVHFSGMYLDPSLDIGYTIQAPYSLWANSDDGSAWTCIATTLAEAWACSAPEVEPTPGGPSVFFNQTDDSVSSHGSHYNDNWYQLGRGFAGTMRSLTLEGMIDQPEYLASYLWLKAFKDENYTQLVQTYTISDNAPFTYNGFKKVTFSNLNIPINPNYYYRLDTLQEYQNRSVILKGTPGIGTAMSDDFVLGVGRVESHYAFYPYIVANGDLNEPLVIVPGVMGSSLDAAPGATASGKEFWPDVTDMANSGSDDYLDALRLAPDGAQIPGTEMVARDIIREATGTYNRLLIPIPLDQTIFGNLIKVFTDAGYVEGQDLFAVPYDWRASIASSAAAVGAVIQNAVAHSATGKINIIAHSMGGMAVKYYLASSSAQASTSSFVDKLIFAGVPQLGAPFIFKALQYGDDLGFKVGPFSLLNPAEVKSIAQNMPGIYQLLPSRRYVDVAGGYVAQSGIDDAGNETTKILNFDETNDVMTMDPLDSRNAALLASADAFHAAQDESPVRADTMSVYNIVGCENPTPSQYVLHDDGAIDINRTNGDGSVPIDSAMNFANGYENYFMLNSENGVDHQGLVVDSQPLALMKAIVQGETSTLALQPLGISTDTEDCLLGRGAPRPAMIEISASGSSTVDVYDAAGNHTGSDDAGDGSAEIPGSSLDTIGSNTFVTVPASSTYTVKIKQSSSSTAASVKAKVKVKKYDTNAHLATTTTYSDVPLVTTSSIATLMIPATTTLLTVDEDGPNTTSTVIVPDASGDLPPVHIPLSCAEH